MKFHQLLQLRFPVTALFFKCNFHLVVYQTHFAKYGPTETKDTLQNSKHYERKHPLPPQNASRKTNFTLSLRESALLSCMQLPSKK